MRKIIFLLLYIPLIATAQSFNSPESVEYDVVNTRWLVGNHGSGKVLSYDPSSGTLTDFCSGMGTGPYGIEILGNVLYCCDGGWIRGYSLSGGANVFNLNLNASFLNGITSDGSNTLFVTDYSAKKIYRVNVSVPSFNQMTTMVKSPNGIVYDGANNRCVFATWGANAAVQAMSLADSTISTLITTTLSNIDGITRDLQGNYYLTSWGNQSLSKTDSTFSYNPAVVKSGLGSPADIDISAMGDSIGIPNSGSLNNVVFYQVNNTTHAEENNSLNTKFYPNPADNRFFIELADPVINATLEIHDSEGKLIAQHPMSGRMLSIERGNLSPGHYTVTVRTVNKNIFTNKILFL